MATSTQPKPPAARAKSFHTGRQFEFYQNGPKTAADRIPLAVEDLEEKARSRLTVAAYDWIAGGAGAQQTVRANRDAFAQWQIVPRMLRDVHHRDLSVEMLGTTFDWPVLLAPIGVQSLMHPEGEKASAQAAAAVNVPFILSTVASHTIEEVAAVSDGPRWFQLYWSKDPELTVSLLQRAEAARYSAVVVTLDTQVLGWRERNLQLGFLPFLQGDGLANYFSDPVFCSGLACPPEEDLDAAVAHYLNVFSNLQHTWDDLAFLREHTHLPILLKGIQHPDDARRAVDAGMDGIVVSNHGGRQVDGGIGALDALPNVVRVADDRIPVLMDSGIRRGADVFKALALGARAVLLGRPYMWALAVGGATGVEEYLKNFLADVDLTFALSGKRSAREVERDDIRSIGGEISQ